MLPFVTGSLRTDDLFDVMNALQDATKVLNDQSKLAGVFGVASKAFGKGSVQAVSALCDALHTFRVFVLYQELTVDSFTKEPLVGTKKKVFCST